MSGEAATPLPLRVSSTPAVTQKSSNTYDTAIDRSKACTVGNCKKCLNCLSQQRDCPCHCPQQALDAQLAWMCDHAAPCWCMVFTSAMISCRSFAVCCCVRLPNALTGGLASCCGRCCCCCCSQPALKTLLRYFIVAHVIMCTVHFSVAIHALSVAAKALDDHDVWGKEWLKPLLAILPALDLTGWYFSRGVRRDLFFFLSVRTDIENNGCRPAETTEQHLRLAEYLLEYQAFLFGQVMRQVATRRQQAGYCWQAEPLDVDDQSFVAVLFCFSGKEERIASSRPTSHFYLECIGRTAHDSNISHNPTPTPSACATCKQLPESCLQELDLKDVAAATSKVSSGAMSESDVFPIRYIGQQHWSEHRLRLIEDDDTNCREKLCLTCCLGHRPSARTQYLPDAPTPLKTLNSAHAPLHPQPRGHAHDREGAADTVFDWPPASVQSTEANSLAAPSDTFAAEQTNINSAALSNSAGAAFHMGQSQPWPAKHVPTDRLRHSAAKKYRVVPVSSVSVARIAANQLEKAAESEAVVVQNNHEDPEQTASDHGCCVCLQGCDWRGDDKYDLALAWKEDLRHELLRLMLLAVLGCCRAITIVIAIRLIFFTAVLDSEDGNKGPALDLLLAIHATLTVSRFIPRIIGRLTALA